MASDAPVFFLPDPGPRQGLALLVDDLAARAADLVTGTEPLLLLMLGGLTPALVAALTACWALVERSRRRRAERALEARPFVVIRDGGPAAIAGAGRADDRRGPVEFDAARALGRGRRHTAGGAPLR